MVKYFNPSLFHLHHGKIVQKKIALQKRAERDVRGWRITEEGMAVKEAAPNYTLQTDRETEQQQ